MGNSIHHRGPVEGIQGLAWVVGCQDLDIPHKRAFDSDLGRVLALHPHPRPITGCGHLTQERLP